MTQKIVMIGAGSVVFCKLLMSDIMATPALAGSEFALVSRTWPKLERMEEFGQRMLKDNGIEGEVWATLDRREAIKDADPYHPVMLVHMNPDQAGPYHNCMDIVMVDPYLVPNHAIHKMSNWMKDLREVALAVGREIAGLPLDR